MVLDRVGHKHLRPSSLNKAITRAGLQDLDTLPGAVNGDWHGAFSRNAGGPEHHEFFRLLIDSVTYMPAGSRSTIQNSGSNDRPADLSVDLSPFIFPVDSALGIDLAIGAHKPESNALSCPCVSNDGPTWLEQAPRVISGPDLSGAVCFRLTRVSFGKIKIALQCEQRNFCACIVSNKGHLCYTVPPFAIL